jgi:hypothetical protein
MDENRSIYFVQIISQLLRLRVERWAIAPFSSGELPIFEEAIAGKHLNT